MNHPHICTLFDIGRDGETDFLVMEYLDGETLAQRAPHSFAALPEEDLRQHFLVQLNAELGGDATAETFNSNWEGGGGGKTDIWVYPGFPTLFWGLSGFFVDDLMGKALWKLVENAQRFPRCGGRVLCVHGAGSFHRAHPYATRSPRPRTAVDP